MKILHKYTGAVLLEVKGASLQDAYLEYANLRGANLQGADLSYANLECANLRDANLEGANLEYANLSYADLEDANLKGANLYGANLRRANLCGANLKGANIKYCIGNGAQIKTFIGAEYHISYTKDVLAIGCKQATIEQWKMDEVELGEADKVLWKKYKDVILFIVDVFPAE